MASVEFQVTDKHLTYRLTDVNELIQLTEFIRKVSLSITVMNQVSPTEVIDLIAKQNWFIQKMNKMLESSKTLQHPVNMQDQFFSKS